MHYIKLLIVLLVILLIMAVGAVFAVLNADVVHFNYYFASIDLPLSVLLVGFLFTGALLGIIVAFFVRLGLKQENAQLSYQVELRTKELDNLRSEPLKD